MSVGYPMVPLGEVVTHRKSFIDVNELQTYTRCRVQLHAKGIVLRDVITGAEIKTKRQQVCRANDLLVAEIDAKVGGYGIVPIELDGAIVSSHYFLFTVNEALLDVRFLGYYLRTPGFFEQVQAKGSTNYAAIRASNVLSYAIPLPPLDEQRRIVARVEELAGKIEAARGLRRLVVEECNLLLRGFLSHSPTQLIPTALKDLVVQRKPNVVVQPDEQYHFSGVYSFGRGVFRGEVKAGAETAYKVLTRLQAGDFVYPKLMAWEGALGVVPPECDGLVVSPEFPVFKIDESKVLPETLDVYFRNPSVWPTLAGESTGTNARRRRLHPNEFLAHRMPLPPMGIQLLLRTVKARTDALKRLQDKSVAELDALLPSVLDRAFGGGL